MNEKQRKALWEELRLIQDTINKFDDITFKIKSWFITIFVAVTGYSMSQSKPALLMLNFLFIVMFYMYEVTYRLPLGAFLRRSREIQRALRGEEEDKKSISSPNLDRHLLDTSTLDADSKWLRFFLNLGIERKRAERNVLEWKEIAKRAYTLLFQLRASLIYLCAVLINVIALLMLC
jgi:hypothetical protein